MGAGNSKTATSSALSSETTTRSQSTGSANARTTSSSRATPSVSSNVVATSDRFSSTTTTHRTTKSRSITTSTSPAVASYASSSSIVPSSAADSTTVSSITSSSLSTTSSVVPQATSSLDASTSNTAASASNSNSGDHGGLSPGAIAAAVVVPVVVIALLGFFLFFCLRKRRNSSNRRTQNVDGSSRPNEKPTRQVFSRGISSFGTTSPTAEDDAEKRSELDHELTQMQRPHESNTTTGITYAAPAIGLSIPRRPQPITPPLQPTTSDFDNSIKSLSTTPPSSSASSTPTLLNSPSTHHPSGSIACPPTLPEVDTGRFFDTPIESSKSNADPFGDPAPGETPSPVEKKQGRYLGAHHVPPPRLQHIPYQRPSNPQIPSLAAITQPSPTTATPTTIPPSPVDRIAPHYLQARPPFNRLGSNHTAHSIDKHPKSPTESDAFSILSGGDDDDGDADADAEVGVAEYATTARVAQVAQVVGGGAGGRGNRASVVQMGSPVI